MAHVHLPCTTHICTCPYITDIPCVAHAMHASQCKRQEVPARDPVDAPCARHSPTPFEGTTKSADLHADMLYRTCVVAMLLAPPSSELNPCNSAMFSVWALTHA